MKVLVLSRNYPSNVFPLLGIWVEGLVRHLEPVTEVRVVSPVPYCPPLPAFVKYTRFRQIPTKRQAGNVQVTSPRFLTGPGYSLHSFEASSYYWGIRRHIGQLRREFPFDLIHAHFSYPDGVVAARLGRDYGVPVVITEHAAWQPWMDQYPRVRRQAVRASGAAAFHLAGSRYLLDSIAHFTGEGSRLRLMPIGFDAATFAAPADPVRRDPDQIIYVGRFQPVKGVDVLIKAMRLLVDQHPSARLLLVGGSHYRGGQRDDDQIRDLVAELKLTERVEFAGTKPPAEVARLLRQSALLVLPSRRETFGAVLVEALASGIPVVSTRCGGPEDIVNERVGFLVPKENEESLSAAIYDVLGGLDRYDPAELRAYALENYSLDRIARRHVELYEEALGGLPTRDHQPRDVVGLAKLRRTE